jgi:L-serine dehydratase
LRQRTRSKHWTGTRIHLPSYPSIFNDVIGPVMRGPSSSHCAAALRIGRMARDLMDGRIEEVVIELDRHGSLATTHTSQGSDMGLFGGLLGWEATDERLIEAPSAIREAGIGARIEIKDMGAGHPNTYKLTLYNSTEQHTLTALSVGGGMVEISEIDGFEVSVAGDYYETLVYLDSSGDQVLDYLRERTQTDRILLLEKDGAYLVEVKAQRFPDENTRSDLSRLGVRNIKTMSPVLPVLSRNEMAVPFISCAEMLGYQESLRQESGKDLELWELAVLYESARGNFSGDEVFRKMREIVGILQDSIRQGLEGSSYADRILGNQSGKYREQMERGHLIEGGLLNRIILYVTAIMEAKSSMNVIVAAPTAGSCGGLPGAIIGAADTIGLSLDDVTRAMLAAGMVGVFIAAHATFAAEVGGCQAECGAGSGMAAAALVTLAGGTVRQAVCAASMALQNVLGMVCDPVANRVEVPCLGKNVMAASNALACANMALAGYDEVIPLDQVIEAMDRVGKSLPSELRCTGLGGLSMTRAAKKVEERLEVDKR